MRLTARKTVYVTYDVDDEKLEEALEGLGIEGLIKGLQGICNGLEQAYASDWELIEPDREFLQGIAPAKRTTK